MSRRPLPTPLSGPRGFPLMAYGGQSIAGPDGYPFSNLYSAPYAYPQTPPTVLANGAPRGCYARPLLRHELHGAEIIDVRKALTFAGFTYKSPRVISYVRADKAFDSQPDTYGQPHPEAAYGQGTVRGRSALCLPQDIGKSRTISM
ncbi:hypothetical protein C8J57DRAFT_1711052 [Mycena rebaudengoi]|nr:hypothetical protein C8J57DRAFT_1711052 [Mycena rebaudengoi]